MYVDFGGQREERSVALGPHFPAGGGLFATEGMSQLRKRMSVEMTIRRARCTVCAELQVTGRDGAFLTKDYEWFHRKLDGSGRMEHCRSCMWEWLWVSTVRRGIRSANPLQACFSSI